VRLYCFVPENGGSEAVERFRRAALAAAALGHPNIAAVREIGETGDGRLYISLPSSEGETLAGLLARGPLPLRDAFDVAAQIAAALARAHAAGIVHGDLRPSYVLATTYGEVKVAAFGLGELAEPGEKTLDEGAAAYRAPEVRRGAAAGAAADVWSLGAILQEMIAGRDPFQGEARPKAYERLLARTLAPVPQERYPDAGPLEVDLLHAFAALGGEATHREMPAVSDGSNGGGGGGRFVPGGRSAADPEGPTPHGIAGRKLLSYRVFERLGSGGMAVVYRAEDIRLERMVALKFLAPELSRDPQAKDRFLREARAASSLDHPNVCTVHEIGETEDGQIFLAMPFYGGETLAQRIARGPLPLDAAVDIACQIAQGLAKAHRRGIVHRDIKPANVMLTADGVVKIVDFGLAKLADSSGPRSNTSRSGEGSGGGTIAYASPEQVRGESVDLRTDLWSLGVVLYEMVTGRKPFPGDQDHAVLFAIQRDEPRPPAELRPDTPPELAHIIGRLLAKDREQRTSSAEAAAADLRTLRGPETVGQAIAPPARRPRRRRLLRSLAAAAALLAAALLVWRFFPGGPEPWGTLRAPSYMAIADQPGRMMFPSLSPDARSLVYAVEKEGGSDIYWQRVGGETVKNLTAEFSGPDTQPAFSPDGATIVFRSEREGGGLFTMGATGESVRRISNFGYNPAWSPDGREVVCATEEVANPGERGTMSQLWRIDLVSNMRRRVPTADAVQPSWSPHGWRLAYWGIPAGTSRRVIRTVPPEGGDAVPVVDDGALNWSPVWSPDGAYLYYASDHSGAMGLWRVAIDERSGKTRGEPQAVTVPVSSCALPSLSRDGRHIAFATANPKSNLFLIPFDPVRREIAGTLRAVTQGSRVVRSADMSPDGAWIVFDTAETQEDLFLVRRDGTGLRALTADAARDRGPHWSPDGRRILFYSDRGGKYQAYTVAPDGERTGDSTGLLTAISGEGVLEPLWAPDGRSLVYLRLDAGLALLNLTQPPGERRPRPLPVDGQPPASFAVTSWSADGRWLAGYDDHARIVLYSFPARRYETLPEHGQEVVWLRDGKTLLFLRGGAVWMLDRPTGAVRRLLEPTASASFARLTVAPGDRALILVVAPSEGSIGMITLP
jgi:eukaryotic-like serine/threonine-protein kinase